MIQVYKATNIQQQSSFITGNYAIQYSTTEFATPKIGKIFVYKDLKSACRHVVMSQLWLAETDEIFEIDRDTIMASQMTDSLLAHYWEENLRHHIQLSRPLEGAIWCDRLRLIERIDW